jgi:hypothetical protein
MPSIKIRFIRTIHLIDTETCESMRDDVVQISRLNEVDARGIDMYTLDYRPYSDPAKTETMRVNADKVFVYARALLRLLEHDADPFRSIQIDFPSMPSVLIKMTDLGNAVHSILDALDFTLENWQSPPTPTPAKEESPSS